MPGDPQREKWDRRYRDGDPARAEPAEVLRANAHLLPAHGTALDLACGLGANAVCLARHGFTTHAWDFSTAAIDKLAGYAAASGLPLSAQVRDVCAAPPAAASFDVIVVSFFLERDLAPALCAALRPGGLLFYQTFTRACVDESGPANPAYRLARNELLRLFHGLAPVVYREENTLGDISRGWRNQAMLVAQKAPLAEARS